MSDAPQHPDRSDRSDDGARPEDGSGPGFERPGFEQSSFEQSGFQQPDFQQPGYQPGPPQQNPYPPGGSPADPNQGGPYQRDPYQGGPYQADPYQTDPYHGGPVPSGPFPNAQLRPGIPDQGAELPPERVGRGIALALLALPVGIVLTALIYRLGFIASISTFAMAALAPFLYQKASGGRLRKGIPGIVALVIAGVVLCFFAVVTTELVRTYGTFGVTERSAYGTLPQFWAANVVNPDVLGQFAKDGLLFLLFAALGIFGVFRRLARASAGSRES